MARVTAYFVSGRPIVASEPRGAGDDIVLQFLKRLRSLPNVAFSAEGNDDILQRFGRSLDQWEFTVGELTAGSSSLTAYRYFPDWCFDCRWNGQQYGDGLVFSEHLEGLSDYFFSPPHSIITDEEFAITAPTVNQQMLAGGRIARTIDDYTAASDLSTRSRMTITGADSHSNKLLKSILVVEYDLRIISRNLLRLRQLQGTTAMLGAALDAHLEMFLSSPSEWIRPVMPPPLGAVLQDLSDCRRLVRTYGSDAFTAIHDLRNYLQDAVDIIGEGEVAGFYLGQSHLANVKCSLLMASVDSLIETGKFLESAMNLLERRVSPL